MLLRDQVRVDNLNRRHFGLELTAMWKQQKNTRNGSCSTNL